MLVFVWYICNYRMTVSATRTRMQRAIPVAINWSFYGILFITGYEMGIRKGVQCVSLHTSSRCIRRSLISWLVCLIAFNTTLSMYKYIQEKRELGPCKPHPSALPAVMACVNIANIVHHCRRM